MIVIKISFYSQNSIRKKIMSIYTIIKAQETISPKYHQFNSKRRKKIKKLLVNSVDLQTSKIIFQRLSAAINKELVLKNLTIILAFQITQELNLKIYRIS